MIIQRLLPRLLLSTAILSGSITGCSRLTEERTGSLKDSEWSGTGVAPPAAGSAEHAAATVAKPSGTAGASPRTASLSTPDKPGPSLATTQASVGSSFVPSAAQSARLPGVQSGTGSSAAHLRLLTQGRDLLRAGKVGKARELIVASVPGNPAEALLELGRSYDPYYLSILPSIDSGSDPRQAVELYEQAIALGSVAAVQDRDRLRRISQTLR